MNKRLLKQTVLSVGALLLIGSVSADAYYTHELAERVASRDVATASANPAAAPVLHTTPTTPAAPAQTANRLWSTMNAQMNRMQAQMNRMFNSAFQNPGGMDFIDGQGSAQVSLHDKGNDYVVTAKIPGARRGDINVRLSGQLLTLSSSARGGSSKTANNGRMAQQDQYASSFQQAFTLPGPVDAAKMTSNFKNGVLTLTIPKA